MFHRFKWTAVAEKRNRLTAEAEPIQPFFLLALADLAGCRTFLDIGANVGCYSLFATQLAKLERCIAFEANPSTANELRANIALNQRSIDVIEAAVSNQVGEVSFGVVSEFAGDNAVLATAFHDGFKKHQTVPAITLDSLGELPGPICLKIDVEGHEREVMTGAARILSGPCVIQVEDFDSATGAILEPLGYFKLTDIGPDRYFTNIDELRGQALPAYETAVQAFTESTLEAIYAPVQVTLRKGDFALKIGGKSYTRLKRIKRLVGSLVRRNSDNPKPSSPRP